MNEGTEGRKIRANGARTKRRLLEGAVALWSERGLLGVTVSAVAERAGTTRRTVYHHFATLEILLDEARGFVQDRLVALASGEAADFANPYGFVAGLAADNPELVKSVLLDLMRDDPAENPIFARSLEFFRRAECEGQLREGVPGEHAASITLSMWLAAMLTVSLVRDPHQRRKQAEQFAQSFETLLRHGILTDGGLSRN